MRRGVIGTDALETINAAATAIASAETRGRHHSIQKKRRGTCWSLYLCLGSNKQKRIGHAVLTPETTTTAGSDPSTSNRPSQHQSPSITRPFATPPSSSASFPPSELPSVAQSPTGLVSMTSMSANMYSPGGPESIFAIGPYAYETQLVSPPVFSTFTTEPSTASYTPPPESAHLTTPSSPEVPFAQLLEPNRPSGAGQRCPLTDYEFQSYQLQPGRLVSHLISPSSGISGSGTSSPFLDRDFSANYPLFLEFRTGKTPKLMDLDKIVRRDWGSSQGCGAVTPDTVGPRPCDCRLLNRQDSDVAPLPDTGNSGGTVVDNRVSFEITTEEVIRCVAPKSTVESVENVEHTIEENTVRTGEVVDCSAEETSNTTAHEKNLAEQQREKTRTITLGSTKEFNFNNLNGGNLDEPIISSSNHWSFSPIMQSGVS